MSTNADSVQKLQQNLQMELINTNELLMLMYVPMIESCDHRCHCDPQNWRQTAVLFGCHCSLRRSEELNQIKSFTSSGGEFESTIKQNASLMATLASMQKLDIENLPPVARTQIELGDQTNEKATYEQDSFRSRDESQ